MRTLLLTKVFPFEAIGRFAAWARLGAPPVAASEFSLLLVTAVERLVVRRVWYAE